MGGNATAGTPCGADESYQPACTQPDNTCIDGKSLCLGQSIVACSDQGMLCSGEEGKAACTPPAQDQLPPVESCAGADGTCLNTTSYCMGEVATACPAGERKRWCLPNAGLWALRSGGCKELRQQWCLCQQPTSNQPLPPALLF